MNALPGLRERIYLNGVNLALHPSAVKPMRSYAETHERLADSTLSTERPTPYTSCEVRTRKFGYAISWESIAAADVNALEDFDAYPGPIDLCVWRPITERFIAAAAQTTFALGRRIALNTISAGLLPVNAATRYETDVTVNGTLKTYTTDYTWGTVTALGRTPLVFASGLSANDVVLVRYVPLFYAQHIGTDPGFSEHREPRTITFDEAS